eukprot:c23310_g2_i2 orf=2-2230(-)
MDSSNPLSVVQTTSPTLPTVQPSSGQTGFITSTAIQTPQMSAMMQQATLQQLNLQQAILMQQYALAQQAATKAATTKSPAEVAAARAAEISKKLKEIDATEKKPSERSKSRSVSKSASRSRSRSASRSLSRSKSKSKSKSRSRSPIRYRRTRSGSRSPIRYRRDHYSSYRARDHYGYRGYNYRSYYRGSYNDYSRYRYGRDRDYQYRRRSRSRGRRRSRTKSRSPIRDRSRGRGRSQTLSPPAKKRSHTRSPRDSRKESVSPHAKRDGTRSRHSPKRSASREAVRSLSVSSGSVNLSPAAKSRSRSPSLAKPVRDYNVDQSPSYDSHEDRTAVNYRRQKKDSSVSSQRRMHSSSSPTRSLSVSLDNQSYKIASNEVTARRRSSGEHLETSKRRSSDEHDETLGKKYRSKLEEEEGGKRRPSEGRRVKKLTRSPNAIFHDDIENDEVLDDWRDDLQNVVKGKGISTYKAGEVDRHGDRGKRDIVEAEVPEMDSSVKVIANDIEPKLEPVLNSASSEGHSNSLMAAGEQQDAISDKGYGPVVVRGDGESLLEERRHVAVVEDAQEIFDEGNEPQRVFDDDVIFEGPKPANLAYEERIQSSEAGGTAIDAHSIDVELPCSKKLHKSAPDQKNTGGSRNVEDDDNGTKISDGLLNSHEEKVRNRSRSRDGRKHEGELSKHEKRRDRHRKHRRKHRHENADEDSAKSDGARRRHKRKHRREGEHGNKERKKRKHKHRTRSSSVSADDT